MLDVFFIAYLIGCSVKGASRGVGKELEGFIFSLLLLGALLGIFVISQLTGLIKMALQFTLSDSGFLISLSSFFIAVIALFSLRKRLSGFTESRFSKDFSRRGGAIFGLTRGLVVVIIITILLINLPFGLLTKTVHNSFLASPVLSLVVESPRPVEKVSSEESDELIIGY